VAHTTTVTWWGILQSHPRLLDVLLDAAQRPGDGIPRVENEIVACRGDQIVEEFLEGADTVKRQNAGVFS